MTFFENSGDTDGSARNGGAEGRGGLAVAVTPSIAEGGKKVFASNDMLTNCGFDRTTRLKTVAHQKTKTSTEKGKYYSHEGRRRKERKPLGTKPTTCPCDNYTVNAALRQLLRSLRCSSSNGGFRDFGENSPQ